MLNARVTIVWVYTQSQSKGKLDLCSSYATKAYIIGFVLNWSQQRECTNTCFGKDSSCTKGFTISNNIWGSLIVVFIKVSYIYTRNPLFGIIMDLCYKFNALLPFETTTNILNRLNSELHYTKCKIWDNCNLSFCRQIRDTSLSGNASR